ncbi:hypothetical protein T09_2118 [Trichinella sp. T9]|nr:hypothetical protein T09_2118 [Trichinella sp. T9]
MRLSICFFIAFIGCMITSPAFVDCNSRTDFILYILYFGI